MTFYRISDLQTQTTSIMNGRELTDILLDNLGYTLDAAVKLISELSEMESVWVEDDQIFIEVLSI